MTPMQLCCIERGFSRVTVIWLQLLLLCTCNCKGQHVKLQNSASYCCPSDTCHALNYCSWIADTPQQALVGVDKATVCSFYSPTPPFNEKMTAANGTFRCIESSTYRISAFDRHPVMKHPVLCYNQLWSNDIWICICSTDECLGVTTEKPINRINQHPMASTNPRAPQPTIITTTTTTSRRAPPIWPPPVPTAGDYYFTSFSGYFTTSTRQPPPNDHQNNNRYSAAQEGHTAATDRHTDDGAQQQQQHQQYAINRVFDAQAYDDYKNGQAHRSSLIMVVTCLLVCWHQN